MSNPWFKFKKFTVYHDKCAMKVGTDGVLIGAWTNLDNVHSVLDVGTGSGLIGLMVAQRSNALITGIDTHTESINQAISNCASSPWCSRLSMLNKSYQEFANESQSVYDLIISNPPFFSEGIPSPKAERGIARHSISLTPLDILISADKLLTAHGKVSMILPLDIGQKLIENGVIYDWYPQRITFVADHTLVKPKRVMVELSRIKQNPVSNTLFLKDSPGGKYTLQTVELLKEFYLYL